MPRGVGVRVSSSSLLMFFAEIAQLVEHNLAKVGVASSSLVFRSQSKNEAQGSKSIESRFPFPENNETLLSLIFFCIYLFRYLLPLDTLPPPPDPLEPLKLPPLDPELRELPKLLLLDPELGEPL